MATRIDDGRGYTNTLPHSGAKRTQRQVRLCLRRYADGGEKWADDPDRRGQRPAAPIRHPRSHKRFRVRAPKRAGLVRRRSPDRRGDRELKPLTGTLTISPARLIHRSAWNRNSAKFAKNNALNGTTFIRNSSPSFTLL